jgi:hypothetical protein
MGTQVMKEGSRSALHLTKMVKCENSSHFFITMAEWIFSEKPNYLLIPINYHQELGIKH